MTPNDSLQTGTTMKLKKLVRKSVTKWAVFVVGIQSKVTDLVVTQPSYEKTILKSFIDI